jgi:hypothetical protein
LDGQNFIIEIGDTSGSSRSSDDEAEQSDSCLKMRVDVVSGTADYQKETEYSRLKGTVSLPSCGYQLFFLGDKAT